jgi:hypothetical protein
MPKGVPGLPVAIITAGGILTWSGIYNQSLTNALGSIIQGKAPTAGAQTVTNTSTAQADLNTGTSIPGVTVGIPAGVASGSNEAVLEAVAATHGWVGSEWTALYNVEMREAGFNLTAQNASGAYGMAQFIGGPSEYAEYGGNSTSAFGQSVAMCNYIAQRYGTPSAAWAHEQTEGWY